jgi:hypothetical protein
MSVVRPESCHSCRLHFLPSCAGFCADTGDPQRAKIAVMFPSPTKDGALSNNPFLSWFYRDVIAPAGFKKEDLLLSHAIRCVPPKTEEALGKRVSGKGNLTHALQVCRQSDGLLGLFNPNLAIVGVEPAALIKTPAYAKLLREAVFKRAYSFYTRGYRSVVLLGPQAASLVLPFIGDSVKSWVGHYAVLAESPFKESQVPW